MPSKLIVLTLFTSATALNSSAFAASKPNVCPPHIEDTCVSKLQLRESPVRNTTGEDDPHEGASPIDLHPPIDRIIESFSKPRFYLVGQLAIEPDEAQAAPKTDDPVKHLFVATLLLRRLESVELTEAQRESFNDLSRDLRKRIDAMRQKVGITKDVIKRRDEVYSELKKTDLKGDQLWETLREKAGLTVAQRDVFRKTQEEYSQFENNVMKLLTEEQRKKLPKGKRKQAK